ncbi:MAG: 4-hydroxy-tetrahydrodipicolinate synthase [Ruminococcaceae bacterium]|nr:4-hydroxy-tetrahydrodipicolinate synthase [Oscillospiraceae bacterium]
MSCVFTGSGVALVTPFSKDGKIDYDVFEKLIEFQTANNTDAIIVCGTTGEGSTLSVEERLSLFRFAAEKIRGRAPLICGTGSNSTFFTLDVAKEAEKCGADAHLMVTPYYNKTSQKGLIRHYFYLADRLEKPVIVYNVPSRTGMNITPETYRELSCHENIRGVKEADTNIVKLQRAVYLCEDRLDFYVGNDDMISSACAVGCKGVVSVLANILPAFTHKMAEYGVKGKNKECLEMQNEVMELAQKLFCDVNPIPVKEAMNMLGMCTARMRMPLANASEGNLNLISDVLDRYGYLIKNEKQL